MPTNQDRSIGKRVARTVYSIPHWTAETQGRWLWIQGPSWTWGSLLADRTGMVSALRGLLASKLHTPFLLQR